MLVKLEADISAFLMQPVVELRLPPLSAYHRLLTHKVAEFYNLDRYVENVSVPPAFMMYGHGPHGPHNNRVSSCRQDMTTAAHQQRNDLQT